MTLQLQIWQRPRTFGSETPIACLEWLQDVRAGQLLLPALYA
jgi:hypothetical protein